jgi:hypothetical protein
MAAWDLTTRKDQAVATGLYIFSVEDLETGAIERGKFLIMKFAGQAAKKSRRALGSAPGSAALSPPGACSGGGDGRPRPR